MSYYCIWCGGTESHIEKFCPLSTGVGWTWGKFPKDPLEALHLNRLGYLRGTVLNIEYHPNLLKPLDVTIVTRLSLEEAYFMSLGQDKLLERFYYLEREPFSEELKSMNYKEFKDYRNTYSKTGEEGRVLKVSLKNFYKVGEVEARMCFDEVPTPKNFPKNITWLPVWRIVERKELLYFPCKT